MEKSSRDLLKMATKKKKGGDIKEAIELLRKAYVQAEKEGKCLLIKEKLRLPVYLRVSSRGRKYYQSIGRTQ